MNVNALNQYEHHILASNETFIVSALLLHLEDRRYASECKGTEMSHGTTKIELKKAVTTFTFLYKCSYHSRKDGVSYVSGVL